MSRLLLALFDYLPLELNCGLSWIRRYFGSWLFGFHVRLIDDRAMTRKNRVGRENIELCTGSDPYETTVASFLSIPNCWFDGSASRSQAIPGTLSRRPS